MTTETTTATTTEATEVEDPVRDVLDNDSVDERIESGKSVR